MVFVGDLHLDKLRKLFPELHLKLQFAEINKVCEYCIKQGIRHLIFQGDIGESFRLSEDATEALLRFLHKWDGKLEFHFILGNHDWAENGVHCLRPFVLMYEFKWFKSVHVHSTLSQVTIGGIDFNMMPYPHTKPPKSKRQAVNVGHFETVGSMRDNGRVIKTGVEVPKKQVVFCGHLHTPHDVGPVHYSGTLYQLNFGESLPKSFTVAKFKYSGDRLLKQVKRIPVDPRFKLINLVVEKRSDLKKVDPNPLYLHKLFLSAGIDLPDNFLTKNPNVVNIDGYANKQELSALIEESFLEFGEGEELVFNHHEGLGEWLTTKGATESQIKRAVELVSKLKV